MDTPFILPPPKGIKLSPHEQYLTANRADQDAAKRMCDTHTLHMMVDPLGHLGHYIAFSMEDGRSDGNLYPTKADAARHQKGDRTRFFYMCTVASDFPPHDALQLLYFTRHAHRNGWVQPDPDLVRKHRPDVKDFQ